MTAPDLPAIHDACLRIAGRSNVSAPYARTLRHPAKDAEYAMHGCANSLESVREFIAGDELILAEIARRTAGVVEKRAA